MTTTKLSTKGQVIIPGPIRKRHHWRPGQTFAVEETEDGVILRAQEVGTPLRQLVGVAGYEGPRKSLRDMEAAIARGVAERYDRH